MLTLLFQVFVLAWLAPSMAEQGCEAGNVSACAAEDSVMMQLKSVEQKDLDSGKSFGQQNGSKGHYHSYNHDSYGSKKKYFGTPEIMYEWVRLKIDPVPQGSDQYGKLFQYNQNTICGLKICNPHVAKACKKETVFATIPRWGLGVPYTLTTVEKTYGGEHVLKPWPSAEAQTLGDCRKIQYVQSMEIDPDGVMWVIDAGHKYFTPSGPGPEAYNRSVDANGVGNGPDGPDLTCPPKMVLIYIPTGQVVQTYVFPPSVVGYTASSPFFGTFLNDIVIDTVKQVAYISDLGGPENSVGGIIVYDRNGNHGRGRSRRFADSTTAGMPGYEIIINGYNYSNLLGGAATDGIGLTPDRKWIVYAKLGNPRLFKLSADAISDFAKEEATWNADVKKGIVDLGDQLGNPDGITMGEDGILYAGAYNLNGANAYKIQHAKLHPVASIRDRDVTPWVDTWAWDNKGYLWMTSNRLNEWFLGAATNNVVTMDFSGKSGTNFKILRTWVGTRSYICAQEGVDCSGNAYN